MDLADGPGLKRSPNGSDGRVCGMAGRVLPSPQASSQIEIKRKKLQGLRQIVLLFSTEAAARAAHATMMVRGRHWMPGTVALAWLCLRWGLR